MGSKILQDATPKDDAITHKRDSLDSNAQDDTVLMQPAKRVPTFGVQQKLPNLEDEMDTSGRAGGGSPGAQIEQARLASDLFISIPGSPDVKPRVSLPSLDLNHNGSLSKPETKSVSGTNEFRAVRKRSRTRTEQKFTSTRVTTTTETTDINNSLGGHSHPSRQSFLVMCNHMQLLEQRFEAFNGQISAQLESMSGLLKEHTSDTRSIT